jgi:pimeloyl-ACP methyl ester carboxylesterase
MTTQFLQLPEGKIAFDFARNRDDSGPLVVCIPGMGDVRQQYRFLADQLVEAGYRVATMDVRGHGESSVGWQDYSVAGVGSDLLALLRHLDAGPALVIGNSMAAGAAVWAAAEAPEWVRALVLIGPAVHGEITGPMGLLMKVLFARPWGAAAWLKYFNTLYPTRKPADWDTYTAHLKDNLSQPGRLEALQKMIFASKAASAERLSRVTTPALILMGTKDPDFKDPDAEAQWVAGQVRGSVVMIEGAGHYPHAEMPEVTWPHIAAFLKELQPEKDPRKEIRHAAPTR